jgi:transitional endoplasmic reticulum ATPase
VTRTRIKLVPLIDNALFQALLLDDESLTLRELICRAPALSTAPIESKVMDQPIGELFISLVDEPLGCPLYRPPGLLLLEINYSNHQDNSQNRQDNVQEQKQKERVVESRPFEKTPSSSIHQTQASLTDDLPIDVSEKDAVRLSYAREIDSAASFLRAKLSVLVVCDKLVVEYLWPEITNRARLGAVVLTVPDEEESDLMTRGLRQRQLASLKGMIKELKEGDVLVIPHLDLLAGGSDLNMSTESRELIELVYKASDRLILAFADRSQDIPEVLAARFAVRLLISGVSRTAVYPNGDERPIGRSLVTQDEAAHFDGFDPEGLYKNVAGMNPIRLRNAIKYAVQEQAGAGTVPVIELYKAIRAFKAQTSVKFEVPDVSFENIGGYDEVKAELQRAIRLMTGSYNLPNEKLRRELIPRGIIFHGPPGTGKTLFAKAIANQLNATIQIVSGPEVTDMYVGESERKVRELFAEARRNAPAVLVFDEFDSIATQRSGRDDGGSRAGNAVVAQILTEMDGFRPDVPMLVIGTTNRLDIIDEALLRPSRFKAIAIDLPNLQARRAIAQVHARHFGLEVPSALIDVIAEQSEGMNGDDIRSIFRDACVGLYCEDPPHQVDAYRLGALVGKLRQSAEKRTASMAQIRTRRVLSGERPSPSTAMIELISFNEEDLQDMPNDAVNDAESA